MVAKLLALCNGVLTCISSELVPWCGRQTSSTEATLAVGKAVRLRDMGR